MNCNFCGRNKEAEACPGGVCYRCHAAVVAALWLLAVVLWVAAG